MIYLFVFIGGMFIGCLLVGLPFVKTGVFGRFKLEPYDDDDTGFYTISIEIEHKELLLHKSYVILKKEESQK